MTKYDREKHLEAVLKHLLSKHFFGRNLEWVWKEGNGILDRDKELYMQIVELMPEVIDKG